MKRFSEIKDSKLENTNSLKNQLISILETLNIKVSGEDTEKLSNIDINIQGKEEIVEKLEELIDDIRITERKNTLNIVKVNSYKNFDMNWLNEQIDNLDKIHINNSFILNEKIKDTQLGDNYRAALNEYMVSNLNGQGVLSEWEFNYDNLAGVFEFDNKNVGLHIKATPFWNSPDKIPFEAHLTDDQENPIDTDSVDFNIEQLLYERYKVLLEDFISSLPETTEYLPKNEE